MGLYLKPAYVIYWWFNAEDIGYRTFRPESVSARKNMDVSAKSMDDSAKQYRRFGKKMDVSAKYIFNSFTESDIIIISRGNHRLNGVRSVDTLMYN